MHGSFVTGAYCLANTVGSQDTSSVTLGGEETLLVVEWSEVTQGIVAHVISHSYGQVAKLFLGHMIKLTKAFRSQLV
jgi:hypothetical protein